MSVLLGIIRDGRVEFESPAPLPEGTRVRVEPTDQDDGFVRDEDWPTTSEGIGELIRHMESFEPVVLTPEDEARIAAAQSATREASIAAVRKQMGLQP